MYGLVSVMDLGQVGVESRFLFSVIMDPAVFLSTKVRLSHLLSQESLQDQETLMKFSALGPSCSLVEFLPTPLSFLCHKNHVGTTC